MKLSDLRSSPKSRENPNSELEVTEDMILISQDRTRYCRIHEGKYIFGQFKGIGRIDQPAHGAGKRHAHHDDKNGNRISVVNDDGTSSHGWTGKLDKGFANTLRDKHGFKIPSNNIVEWIELSEKTELLLG